MGRTREKAAPTTMPAADLATSIAEDAVYLAEGKTIKHRLESPYAAATA
jgi:hypothetical protein